MTLIEWQTRELKRLKLTAETGFSFEFDYGAVTISPTSYEGGEVKQESAAGVVTKIFKKHDASGIKEIVYNNMLPIPPDLEKNTAFYDINAINAAKSDAALKQAVADMEALKTEIAESKEELEKAEAFINELE